LTAKSTVQLLPYEIDAVVNDGGERWWLGALLAPVGLWSVARAQSIANPDDLAAIVALDAILGNDDRHAGNLLVRYDDKGDERVVAIDFAGSWCGVPQSYLDRGHFPPSANALAEGVTLGLVGSAARAAAAGISALTERQLHAFAYEACRVARFGGADELADALVSRCASARAIIDAYLEQLP